MRLLLFMLLSLTFLHSATISGDIYSAEDLEGLNRTIIKISGPQEIQFVAKEDNYSVALPRGNYVITAYYYEGSKLKYYSTEKMAVGDNDAKFDIILFSPGEWDGFVDTTSEINSSELDSISSKQSAAQDFTFYLVVAAVIIAVVLLLFWYSKKKKAEPAASTKPEAKSIEKEQEPFELDEDAKKVLQIIETNEGRMLQRELRDILKFSETKMSLLLSELEVGGLVKRIKKGRGNIIKLIKRDKNG
ncbi:MAG: hypothetical protein V1492_06030 [Candidatus Micrarchaeota archaeon]